MIRPKSNISIKLYREPGWAGNMQIYILKFNGDIVNSLIHIKKNWTCTGREKSGLAAFTYEIHQCKLIETSIQANSMMSLVKSYSDDKVMNGT